MIETPVLIVGGGPVGLTLALDLAWRGIDVTVAEMRHAGEPPSVKCNQLSARSMEIYRRLGIAHEIRALGLPADYANDVVSKEDWIGRRLVADRFHDRRVFICGDAAHLWISTGGYGMNAGIADAANLAWLLAATLKGWAPPAILNAYQAERQPLTEQASRLIMDVSLPVMQQRRQITPELEAPGPAGEALRARVGREAYALDIQQQCGGGLNFGYYYDASPITAYDGETPPAYTMGSFTSSIVPGCRAPHP